MFGLFGKARRFQYQDSTGQWHLSLIPLRTLMFEGSHYFSSLKSSEEFHVACGILWSPLRRRKTSKPPTCPECLERYGKILAGSRQKEK